MGSPPQQSFPIPDLQSVFTNHEIEVREAFRPSLDPPEGVRTVGIVGGGTAGWFTALALRAQLPALDVTVIESKSVPIIGVGEASVPSLVWFLHHYLKLDVLELTREVGPTWKQGIRFEWGEPGDYAFQAPFDWEVNGVGLLGSMAETGDINAYTLQSILMSRDVTPVLRIDGHLHSFLPMMPFAYHLDNQKLVDYVTRQAIARGVRHLDAKITAAEVAPRASADGDPEIAHLVTEDGQKLSFDLYVDCSGFSSLLLEKALGEKHTSYASSLFTDTAIAFNAPHGGELKPYTTARTMESGWCWNIPMVESDHLGYVFSSSHCGEDKALAEARDLWPELTNERVVRFRSGRHERTWVGNVFAIGNAYAFVEPLESTGLLMISRAVTALVRAFPIRTGADSADEHVVKKRFVNTTIQRDWDRLRWFLAIHYKFNRRLDSKFWQEARARVDVSGLQNALDIFRTMGPLSLLPRGVRARVTEEAQIFFYGLSGFDTILCGQKVPFPKLPASPREKWLQRERTALAFAVRALPLAEALPATWASPEWLTQLVDHPGSWVAKAGTWL